MVFRKIGLLIRELAERNSILRPVWVLGNQRTNANFQLPHPPTQAETSEQVPSWNSSPPWKSTPGVRFPMISHLANLFGGGQKYPVKEEPNWSERMRKTAMEMGEPLDPVDPKMVAIFQKLAKDGAYLNPESWKKFDKDTLMDIATASYASLVVFMNINPEIVAGIKEQAGIIIHGPEPPDPEDEMMQEIYALIDKLFTEKYGPVDSTGRRHKIQK